MTTTVTSTSLKLSSADPSFLQGDRYKDLKKRCIKPEHYEAVKQSWERLLVSMKEEMNKINGDSNFITDCKFEDIINNDNTIPEFALKNLKERGCLIIRDVIDDEKALEWKESIKDYIKQHEGITGAPSVSPSNWFLHWSRSQVEARSHPRMVQLMKAAGKVYANNDPEDLVDMDSQVVYADRVRIRSPGKAVTLNLHADSSSIERWEDDNYRDVYKEVFEGDWEKWDPLVINKRIHAHQDIYEGLTANDSTCSVFRSFQGWLALSDSKCGEGTIRFLPNLKKAIPYMLLRPFFEDNESGPEFDVESTRFPGVTPGSGQFYGNDPNLFPHFNHDKSVVGIPYVKPGDFVLWHADLLHEVDKEHIGKSDSSVMYIAHTPLCEYNLETLMDTKKSFTEGSKPKDFAYENGPNETQYEDRGKKEHVLTQEGLQSLGLAKFDVDEEGITPGQKKIRQIANDLLFK